MGSLRLRGSRLRLASAIGLSMIMAVILAGPASAQQPPEIRQGNPFPQGDGGLTIGGVGLIAVHANATGGLTITETIADSIAAANGLEPGDVLTRVNGQDLRQPQDLSRLLNEAGGGAEVQIEGVNVRDGSPIEFSAVLPDGDSIQMGVRTVANRFLGVRIGEVDANGSIAQIGRLERGDLITRVNGRSIRTVRDLEQALARVAGGEEALIEGINVRDGQAFEPVHLTAGGDPNPDPPVTGLTTGGIGIIVATSNVPGGLMVSESIPNGIAAANGLEPGDVLTRVDGRALVQPQDLSRFLDIAGPGSDVTIEGINVRDGTAIAFTASLPNGVKPQLGVRTHANRARGAKLGEVDPEGLIARAGNLERGDVITSVNGRAIRSLRDLELTLGQIRMGDEVTIDGVNVRDGQPFQTVRFRTGD